MISANAKKWCRKTELRLGLVDKLKEINAMRDEKASKSKKKVKISPIMLNTSANDTFTLDYISKFKFGMHCSIHEPLTFQESYGETLDTVYKILEQLNGKLAQFQTASESSTPLSDR